MAKSWTISARDFRGLEQLRWSPRGVCLLAGPNGAGKSTILQAFWFLHLASRKGVGEALNIIGGAAFIRRLGSAPERPVSLAVSIGELEWELTLGASGAGVDTRWGEVIKLGTDVLGRRAIFGNNVFLGREESEADERTVLRMLWDRDRDGPLKPLIDWTTDIRVYREFLFQRVRQPQESRGEAFLDLTGSNLWSVLRNWHGAPTRYRHQFQWVVSALREAFPDLLSTIEIETEGHTVVPVSYRPGSDLAIPLSLAPDGLLQALLVLTAVAGARDGSVVAIDEMENYLHPHAIRALLTSIRKLADERSLTVLLTTHSPVLMNEFKGHEDQFFIIDSGRAEVPTALDDAEDPDWLAHFALGDLYDREQIASPTASNGQAAIAKES